MLHITKQFIKKNPEPHLIMKNANTRKCARKILKSKQNLRAVGSEKSGITIKKEKKGIKKLLKQKGYIEKGSIKKSLISIKNIKRELPEMSKWKKMT